jgi:hypothetical protein
MALTHAITNILTILTSLAHIILSAFTTSITNKATNHNFSARWYEYYIAPT